MADLSKQTTHAHQFCLNDTRRLEILQLPGSCLRCLGYQISAAAIRLSDFGSSAAAIRLSDVGSSAAAIRLSDLGSSSAAIRLSGFDAGVVCLLGLVTSVVALWFGDFGCRAVRCRLCGLVTSVQGC